MSHLINSFEGYFAQVTTTVQARWVNGTVTTDFNSDGYQDALLLGAFYPMGGSQPVSQPGMVLLGGPTGFTPAPQSVFPWQALQTVHPRKVLFEDFNRDGKPDVYIASHGWDTNPFPGEQNMLFMSTPTGYANVTASLPQLSDFTHTAAAADIDRDGDIDIFVGNGYAGQNGILSYMLMNDGAGNFSMTRANLPTAAGEVLDFHAMNMFPGANFVDLNGDALPELVVTADAAVPSHALRQNVVLWNQGGSFSDSAKTLLPASAYMPNQIVLDVAGIDINLDGRNDLVITGTQGQPYYDGWFVQVLLTQADGSFVDATDSVLPADARSGGTPGASSGTPWGMWVKPMDFNGDGFQDFSVEMNGQYTAGTPLVWLNDGTGHFTTIKAGDLTNELWRLGSGHWYESASGWSILHSQGYDSQGRLLMAGITATTPYTQTPDSGMARTGTAGNDRLRGGDGADTLTGQGGIDTAVYFGNKAAFTLSPTNVTRTGTQDSDTLSGVERVEFRDISVAFDLDGHAGQAARILGAVFGREAVGNEVYAGIGLDMLDAGTSYEALMGLALQVALGSGASHAQIVERLYTNVVGNAPSAGELAYYTGLLDDGSYTPAALGVMAAETSFNANNINLVGLGQTGLEFV